MTFNALLDRPLAGNSDVGRHLDELLAELEAALDDGDRKVPNINRKTCRDGQ